jgi:hypothetical protein
MITARSCLAVVSVLAVAGCGVAGRGAGGAAMSKLEEIAAQADGPVYHLGDRYGDWPLTEADLDEESRRIYVIYGDCDATFDSCAPPLQVMTEVLDPEMMALAVGCSRRPAVRGVPAVTFGEALMLLTERSLVTVAVADGDLDAAAAAAEQLHEVGADRSGADLPPPDAAALRELEAACGKQPGDAGPPLPEEPVGPSSTRVPDFTVGRLGGDELRWATYAGQPVVVVVGDVPHVVSGIERVVALTAGRPPAVIGLIWKVFDSKAAPAPITDVEQEIGDLPVPVGYAAVPQPAVWFFDMAELDATATGVIAFVDADGDLIHHLRTDASDSAIRAALDQLGAR